MVSCAGSRARKRLFLPQLGLGCQCCLPALLQGAGHEPVLRLDSIILPLGTLDLIACLLEAQRPLPVPLRALDLHVLGQLQADLDRRGPQHLEDKAGDEPVQRAAAEGLTAWPAIVDLIARALVAQVPPVEPGSR